MSDQSLALISSIALIACFYKDGSDVFLIMASVFLAAALIIGGLRK